VEQLEGSVARLTITVPAEVVDQQIDDTYKAVGRKYRFPGFRRGKAPKPVLEQRLGLEYILGEATELIVGSSYAQAIDNEGLRPLKSPEMKDLKLPELGGDYTYEVEIIVRPKCELSDYGMFEVEMPSDTSLRADIDREIDELREQSATLRPIEDRALEMGDFALVSFVGTLDGEPYEGNTEDRYMYELGSEDMPAEFDKALVGAKLGEERHIEFTVSKNAMNRRYQGKVAGFDVTLHEIKAKVLPEPDDAFALETGGFETLDELRSDIEDRLAAERAEKHRLLRQRKQIEKLASRFEGTVPEVMIVLRQQQMLRDMYKTLAQREIPLDIYFASRGDIDKEQYEKEVLGEAEQYLKEELSLEALFRHEGLEVLEEEVESELKLIAKESDVPVDVARQRWEQLGLVDAIRDRLTHRKALQWLDEHVTVVEEQAVEAAEVIDIDSVGAEDAGVSKGDEAAHEGQEQ